MSSQPLKNKTRPHETMKSPKPLYVSTPQNMTGAHVSAPSFEEIMVFLCFRITHR